MQVRLGVMWSGLEPVEGRYDQEYLEVLRKIIRLVWVAGVGIHTGAWSYAHFFVGILPRMESQLFLTSTR